MLRIGLTGGIGSGKSTVADRLAAHGAFVLDADRVARQVIEPGTPGLASVVEAFGTEVLAADGALDRSALGRTVFGDEVARQRLNGILHPRIAARTAELAASAPRDAVIVHDVPLLVENGLGPDYHLVLVVDAPEPVRIERLRARGLDADDARRRVASQAGEQARRAAADVWLDNAGTPDDLLAAVDRLWRDRLQPYRANLQANRPALRPAHLELVPSRPAWAGQAARLIARIERAAAGRALRVDHIGSTAVPGLPAKDVLDVQVVVGDLAAAQTLAAEMPGAAGLVLREGRWTDGDIPGAAQVEKLLLGAADPARAVNCHLRQDSSPAWRETLLLRDRLRANPDRAAEYAAVKVRAMAQHPEDVEAYASAKTPWIRAELAAARA